LNTKEEKSEDNRDNYPRTSNGSSEHASRSIPQKVKRKRLNLSKEERLIRRREKNRVDAIKSRKKKKDEIKNLKDENIKLKETIESKNEEIKRLKSLIPLEPSYQSLERDRRTYNPSYNGHISSPFGVSEESNREEAPHQLESNESIYRRLNPIYSYEPDEIPYSDTPVENNQEGMFEKEVLKGIPRPPIEDDKDMEEEEKMRHYQNESAMGDITNTLEGQQVYYIIGDRNPIWRLSSSLKYRSKKFKHDQEIYERKCND